jgi:hypothetical protein
MGLHSSSCRPETEQKKFYEGVRAVRHWLGNRLKNQTTFLPAALEVAKDPNRDENGRNFSFNEWYTATPVCLT